MPATKKCAGAKNPKAEKPDAAPYELFLAEWNKLGAPFPKMRGWSDKRKASFRERWSDKTWRENWLAALKAMQSEHRLDFYRGKNDRGWVADPEYFLRPDSVVKLLERADSGEKGVRMYTDPDTGWQFKIKASTPEEKLADAREILASLKRPHANLQESEMLPFHRHEIAQYEQTKMRCEAIIAAAAAKN